MSYPRFPEEGIVRTVEELLALDIPPGERAYSHQQVVTTLAERGAALPLGLQALQAGEEAFASFEFRPPTVRTQSDVAKKVKAAAMHGTKAGKLRAVGVAHALDSIGEISLSDLPDKKRLAPITRLPAGDVGFLLYYQDYLVEDGERDLGGVVYECLGCNETVEQPTVDLGSRPVSTFSYVADAPPRAVYRLRRPFRLGGKEVSKLVLGPASYASVYSGVSEADLNGSDEQRARLVAASIRGTDVAPQAPPVVPVQIGEMHAKDLALCAHAASAVNCEPGAALEHRCPECGERNNLLWSWVQPDFFGQARS